MPGHVMEPVWTPCGTRCACNRLTLICWGPIDPGKDATMSNDRATFTHPVGEIRVYEDALQRRQMSVTGPRAHILVTRDDDHARTPFRVWKSDSIRTILSTTDRVRAVKTACVAAGIDPTRLEIS